MTPIPFEPQQRIAGTRTCGAAALAMVYRSLGKEIPQKALWRHVAEEIEPGAKAVRTHRLALDALGNGFAAAILQAERPEQLLAHLVRSDIRAILNHRLNRDSPLGHFTVLVRFDGREIEFHDPHHGPNRVIPWPKFEQLWGPGGARSETTGHILVAMGPPSGGVERCEECGELVPERWTCGRCGQPVPTGPAGLLSCISSDCPRRLWKRQFCPRCDWARRPA